MKPLCDNSADRPIVIVGAGPCGLGAAWAMQRFGVENWVLLEQLDVVGGLSRSIVDERGFTWDLGGHVTFSHYDLYSRLLDALLGPDGWLEHVRESWVRMADRWIPYPFQNNIHRLDPEDCARCLTGLIEAAATPLPERFETFDEFILATTGEGIAELFMRPYNFKVWAYRPEQMAAQWIAERVAVPDAARVARNVALRQDDTSWGPNNTFRFPRTGGTGAIWSALGERLPAGKLRMNAEVGSVDAEAKTVTLASGETLPYSTLISTMPLDRLVTMTGREEWIRSAGQLKRSSTYIVGVGLEGQPPESMHGKCWLYFPEESSPFYRVTHFSHYSPANVPDSQRCWSLMCEISESPCKTVNGETIEQETVSAIKTMGLCAENTTVAHTWKHRVEYGYPTPSLERDPCLDFLLPALQEENILSRGRFGAWKYEAANMDHSFMQGYEAACHVLFGSPELTVWNPGFVNQKHATLGWGRVK